jgi:hypothetical protein
MANNKVKENEAVEKSDSLNKTILSTAVKTLAILAAAVILAFALFLLVAPRGAGNFFYNLGMKNLAAEMSYSAAKRSDSFDDWYASLVRSVGVENHELTYNSAANIAKVADYDELIELKNITVNQGGAQKTYSAKHYVAYHRVNSGVLSGKTTEGFWQSAVAWTVANKFEEDLNPMKGYIDALTKDVSIEFYGGTTMFLTQIDNLWKGTNKDDENNQFGKISGYLSTAQRKELSIYMLRLIEKRNTADLTGAEKKEWDDAKTKWDGYYLRP